MGLIGWWSALLLSTWQKIAPLYMLSDVVCYQGGLYFFAALNALVGGLGGLSQTGLRSLLAYSSIGHIGWMVYVINYSGSVMLLYFFSYVCHLVFLMIPFAVLKVDTPKDLSCTVFIRAEVKVVLMVFLLSLGGLPPLLGFVPKLLVLSAGTSVVVAFLILGRCINLYYYFSIAWSRLLVSIVDFSIVAQSFWLPGTLGGVFFVSAILFLLLCEMNLYGES